MANQTSHEPEVLWTDRKRTFLGLPWSFTVYSLTKTKLICRRGFLNIIEDEIDLYKITDKKLLLPLGQRMFGCGTIHIDSRDVSLPEFDMGSIKNPREVMQMLDECISEQRDRYAIRGRDLYGMPQHPHHHDIDIDVDDDNDDFDES